MISWERYTIQARVGFSEVSILRSPRIKDLYASDLTQILSCKYFLPHGKWNCEIQEIPIQRWKSPKHISWIQPGIQVLVGLLTGQSFNDMKHNHPFVLTKNWMIIVPKQECNKLCILYKKRHLRTPFQSFLLISFLTGYLTPGSSWPDDSSSRKRCESKYTCGLFHATLAHSLFFENGNLNMFAITLHSNLKIRSFWK